MPKLSFKSNRQMASLGVSFFAFLIGLSAFVQADEGNPLRHSSPFVKLSPQAKQGKKQIPREKSTLSPEILEALYGLKKPKSDPGSHHENFKPVPGRYGRVIDDAAVAPAGGMEKRPDLARVVELLDRLQNEKLGAENPIRQQGSAASSGVAKVNTSSPVEGGSEEKVGSEPPEAPVKFSELAETLAYNTILVLTLAIAFIVMAKQWYGRKVVGGKPKVDGFEVVNTLKLGPKSSLMLVDVGNQRLVVASDAGGVKSVVRLEETLDSFSSVMDQVDAESESETNANSVPQVELEDVLSAVGNEGGKESNAYSLAAIGENLTPATEKTKAEKLAEIQREMEAALAKTGLKKAFMNSLTS